MTFSILNLFLAAFFIFGVHAITRKHAILEVVNSLTEYQGENTFVLAKVVSECTTCMSSFYGMLSYLYFFGKIPNYNPTIELIICLLILTTLIEFIGNRLIQGYKDKFSKMAVYGAQKISLSSYSFLLGFIIFDNKYFEGLIFIIALAGLCNILEHFIIFTKATTKINTSLDSQTSVLANCATEIVEKIK